MSIKSLHLYIYIYIFNILERDVLDEATPSEKIGWKTIFPKTPPLIKHRPMFDEFKSRGITTGVHGNALIEAPHAFNPLSLSPIPPRFRIIRA